jgi:hypothetical protein
MRKLAADKRVDHVAATAHSEQLAVEQAAPPPLNAAVGERLVECFAANLVSFRKYSVDTKYDGFKHGITLRNATSRSPGPDATALLLVAASGTLVNSIRSEFWRALLRMETSKVDL